MIQNKFKLSTHARFVFSTVIIAFVGSLFTQPAILTWIHAHPIYDALFTAAGVAFNAYNTYAQPMQVPPTT